MRSIFLTVILTLSAAVALHGEGPADKIATTTTATAPSKAAVVMSAQELFAKASPAVVKILIYDKHSKLKVQGSGFFVSSDGLLITNYHVIANAVSAKVLLPNGSRLTISGVAALMPHADLVLLKVKGKNLSFLTVARKAPKVGTKVYAIGSPKGLANTISEGIVSGYRNFKDTTTLMQTTAPISPGSSGGPLLTLDGKVVGVTTFYFRRGQNLNFAVPADQVHRLIRKRGKLRTLASVSGKRLDKTVRPTPTAPGSGERSRTAVKLGPRYTDRLAGFSLCPPADTERIMRTSARRLVGWTRRNEQTKAVRWSLEVLRTKHKPTKLLLSEYAEAVAAELSKTGNFKVESTRISVVAGKPAMHFRGIWIATFELWRRQTWVRVKPGEHIVLNISGAPAAKGEMDAVMTAVLESMRFFDPKVAVAEYKQNLARGAAVLKELSVAKLKTIIHKQPYYCTIKLKGKTIGFVQLVESIAKRSGTEGLNVVSSGVLMLPKTPMQLTRKKLFTTPDRNSEQWKQVSVRGRGKTASREIREAIKKDNWLLVQAHRPGVRRRSWKREVPEHIRSAYLPEAFSALLPRLLDRSKAETYAFAIYNPSKNDFDMRTVRVVGEETIRIGAKNVKATRLTDQMSAQAPTANLWVDEKGMLLRMQTPTGLTMERADQKIVAAKFAAELAELDKLKKP